MFKVKFFNCKFPEMGEHINNEEMINKELAAWSELEKVDIWAISAFNYKGSNLISLCVLYREK